MAAHGNAAPARVQSDHEGQERRHRNRCKDKARPHPGRRRRLRPSNNQRQERGGHRQGATEVVEHLPTANRRNDDGAAFLGRCSVAPQNPGQQLPVAARPPVLPGGRCLIVRREVFKQLDIRGQCRPSEDAFKEIMAQQRIVRHLARQGGLKCIDVVNALAGVGPFSEQILVDIRNGRGIRIDAARAGEGSLEERAFTIEGERRGDAWLHQRVAFDDAPGLGVKSRPVERMCHGADQTARSATRQARVGIERDDIANTRQCFRGPSPDGHERGVP